MEVGDISDGLARKELLPVLNALFMGVTLRLPQGRLCYRGAKERLPALPGAAGDDVYVASMEGLYESHCVMSGGVQVDERWLNVGDFSMLRDRLEILDAPPDLVARVNRDMAVQAAFWQDPSGKDAERLSLGFEDWRSERPARAREAQRA